MSLDNMEENKTLKSLIKNIIISGIASILFLVFYILDSKNPLGIFTNNSNNLSIAGLTKIASVVLIILLIGFALSFVFGIVTLIIKKLQKQSDYILSIFNVVPITLSIIFLIDSCFVSTAMVQGSSMLNSFKNEELIAVYHTKNVSVDDVIIIDSQSSSGLIIKRVVAVSGDTITLYQNELIINGVSTPISQSYTVCDNLIDYTLKDGEVFCLGDNRSVSLDSRHFGVFRKSQIVGKVIMKLKPFTFKLTKDLK